MWQACFCRTATNEAADIDKGDEIFMLEEAKKIPRRRDADFSKKFLGA